MIETTQDGQTTMPTIHLDEDGAIEHATGITVVKPVALATPHRKRPFIDYIPKARHIVTEYKLIVQIVGIVIFLIAMGHDEHLANTLYAVGVDFLGDGVLLPRAVIEGVAAAMGIAPEVSSHVTLPGSA